MTDTAKQIHESMRFLLSDVLAFVVGLFWVSPCWQRATQHGFSGRTMCTRSWLRWGVICTIAVLAGCTSRIRPNDDYSLQREAIVGTEKPVLEPLNVGTEQQNQVLANAKASQQQYGTGVFINAAAARGKSGGAANGAGTITFNFDNQPVQSAVKAILGDVLRADFSIGSDVKGTVTFSTSQPVTQDDVLPILQMLLSWTGNALILQNGSYLVVPIDRAAPGNLVPGLGAVSPDVGYAARLFPLHYVPADAMQKLLKPFAGLKAFLLVDPLRNILVMGGTPDELANYQRIVRTFDVDWLRGMSVAVIPLQHVQASEMVRQLNGLFSGSGGDGETMSSLIRMIPLRQSNSLVVIASKPAYIDNVRKLVAALENGESDQSDLYVYDVVNVKAADLAKNLNAVLGGGGGGAQNAAGAVAPGYSPLEQVSSENPGTQQGFGTFVSNGNLNNTGQLGLNGTGMFGGGAPNRQQQSSQSSTMYTFGEGVRVGISENNQLLVRASPSQWKALLPVIKQLDEKPLQVQIETKVLEVTLTGQFQFGVQYYLAGLIGTQPGSPPNTNEPYHRHQGAAGLSGVQYNPANDALFYSFAGNKLQFAISAMESSGNAKMLSAPSTVVLNNQETTFKVGDKIPVVQTYVIPGVGVGSPTGTYNAGQVQYIDTGVLLDVVPRVSPSGLVYLNVQQIVSEPTTKDQYGNYTIANRALSTQVAVQSGQTVLLGGLIQRSDDVQDSGVPFLSRIPVLRRLFGTTVNNRTRTELLVLITPRVIYDPEDARQVMNGYEAKFKLLEPIRPKALHKIEKH